MLLRVGGKMPLKKIGDVVRLDNTACSPDAENIVNFDIPAFMDVLSRQKIKALNKTGKYSRVNSLPQVFEEAALFDIIKLCPYGLHRT